MQIGDGTRMATGMLDLEWLFVLTNAKKEAYRTTVYNTLTCLVSFFGGNSFLDCLSVGRRVVVPWMSEVSWKTDRTFKTRNSYN